MDFMQYPGIPALNPLPREQRPDRFRAVHQELMANHEVYRLQNRRFLAWMGAIGVCHLVALVSIGWAFSQGALSREPFRGVLMALGAIFFCAVSWPAVRHQQFKTAAIQQAVEVKAMPPLT